MIEKILVMNIQQLPLAVYYEHPEWFRPLFAELDRRSIQDVRIDAGCHVYDVTRRTENTLCFSTG